MYTLPRKSNIQCNSAEVASSPVPHKEKLYTVFMFAYIKFYALVVTVNSRADLIKMHDTPKRHRSLTRLIWHENSCIELDLLYFSSSMDQELDYHYKAITGLNHRVACSYILYMLQWLAACTHNHDALRTFNGNERSRDVLAIAVARYRAF